MNDTQPTFMQIINFYANDYGKLYRSCGNCSSQCKRNVYIEGVEARNGGALAGINSCVPSYHHCCAGPHTLHTPPGTVRGAFLRHARIQLTFRAYRRRHGDDQGCLL